MRKLEYGSLLSMQALKVLILYSQQKDEVSFRQVSFGIYKLNEHSGYMVHPRANTICYLYKRGLHNSASHVHVARIA